MARNCSSGAGREIGIGRLLAARGGDGGFCVVEDENEDAAVGTEAAAGGGAGFGERVGRSDVFAGEDEAGAGERVVRRDGRGGARDAGGRDAQRCARRAVVQADDWGADAVLPELRREHGGAGAERDRLHVLPAEVRGGVPVSKCFES